MAAEEVGSGEPLLNKLVGFPRSGDVVPSFAALFLPPWWRQMGCGGRIHL
jgi:hypothetical protein